jgi:hypothetical protein
MAGAPLRMGAPGASGFDTLGVLTHLTRSKGKTGGTVTFKPLRHHLLRQAVAFAREAVTFPRSLSRFSDREVSPLTSGAWVWRTSFRVARASGRMKQIERV